MQFLGKVDSKLKSHSFNLLIIRGEVSIKPGTSLFYKLYDLKKLLKLAGIHYVGVEYRRWVSLKNQCTQFIKNRRENFRFKRVKGKAPRFKSKNKQMVSF